MHRHRGTFLYVCRCRRYKGRHVGHVNLVESRVCTHTVGIVVVINVERVDVIVKMVMMMARWYHHSRVKSWPCSDRDLHPLPVAVSEPWVGCLV